MAKKSKQVEKTPSTNGTEELYTMEDAMKEIKAKEEARIKDEQERLRKFVNEFKVLQAKYNCSFQIDGTSPLNNLTIIPVPYRK